MRTRFALISSFNTQAVENKIKMFMNFRYASVTAHYTVYAIVLYAALPA